MARTTRVTKALPRVHEIRNLTESTYVLRLDRRDLEFEPGQYVSVGVKGDIDMREYSIYSPVDADFLEILVKEIDGGHVSRRLRRVRPGDEVEVDGPFGFFTIDEPDRRRPLLFIATGTGISPFHCFAGSYSDLDFRLLHGVRTAGERYDHDAFPSDRLTTCLSRDPQGVAAAAHVARAEPVADGRAAVGSADSSAVAGRVTDYLREHPVDPGTRCYLCGNCDMIYEAFDILKGHGVAPEHLYAEVYF